MANGSSLKTPVENNDHISQNTFRGFRERQDVSHALLLHEMAATGYAFSSVRALALLGAVMAPVAARISLG